MIPADDEMLAKVNDICSDSVTKWSLLIEALGIPLAIRTKWCTMYLQALKLLTGEMQNYLEERQKSVTQVFTDLSVQIDSAESCQETSETAQSDSSSLYEEGLKLKLCLADLEDKITKSKEEICKRHEFICLKLGRPAKWLTDEDALDLEKCIYQVESLEKEYILRKENFRTTRYELINLANECEYEPTDEFETNILNSLEFPLTDENMILFLKFESFLKQFTNNLNAEIENLIKKIKKLWIKLKANKEHCIAFEREHFGFKKKRNLYALKDELKRLEDLNGIPLYSRIKHLREKLITYWDRCHFSKEQRIAFENLNKDLDEENIYSRIHDELRKVSKFYKANQNLFKALAKFDTASKCIQSTHKPAVDLLGQYRYKCGRNFMEERQIGIKHRLEGMQESILKMADDYFNTHLKEFTYKGVTIKEYFQKIDEDEEELSLNSISSKSSYLMGTRSCKFLGTSKSTSSHYLRSLKTSTAVIHPRIIQSSRIK